MNRSGGNFEGSSHRTYQFPLPSGRHRMRQNDCGCVQRNTILQLLLLLCVLIGIGTVLQETPIHRQSTELLSAVESNNVLLRHSKDSFTNSNSTAAFVEATKPIHGVEGRANQKSDKWQVHLPLPLPIIVLGYPKSGVSRLVCVRFFH
jgi:hypothetical protein